MGRSNRISREGAALRSPGILQETATSNDYLSLTDYAEYGVLSEQLNPLADSQYSQEEFDLAYESIKQIDSILTDQSKPQSEREAELEQAELSAEGLRIAEGIYTELGDTAGNYDEISETFDPDGAFLSQGDSDHLYALANYMKVLREGQVTSGSGEGMGEARYEHYASLVDRAKDISKESIG